MRLDGKVALVTGAGRGIGRGCALGLAERGAVLSLNDRPGCSTDLQATADAVCSLGTEALTVFADVFQSTGCEAVVAQTLARFKRIDILVHVPAFNPRSWFLDCTPDEFQRAVNATLISAYNMAWLVARHMVERGGGGKMVFISSVHASMPYAKAVAYNAAKAGLNQMIRSIAVELARHRINVNAVEPGWIDTPAERLHYGNESIAAAGAELPWGRLGTPQDIGHAVTFLCSGEADYITGEVLRVDGCYLYKDARGPQEKN